MSTCTGDDADDDDDHGMNSTTSYLLHLLALTFNGLVIGQQKSSDHIDARFNILIPWDMKWLVSD